MAVWKDSESRENALSLSASFKILASILLGFTNGFARIQKAVMDQTSSDHDLDEMHRKPENLNACSQHWPIERAQFFCRQCPTTCHTANTSTVEWIGVQSFASSSICAQSCPTPFSRLDLSNLKSKHSASCRPQGPNPGVITICQGFHYQELEGFHGSHISWPDENWIGNLWST